MMHVCGENSDCYEGVYQQFLNGFCGNCLPMAKGLHKRHLEIVVHVWVRVRILGANMHDNKCNRINKRLWYMYECELEFLEQICIIPSVAELIKKLSEF